MGELKSTAANVLQAARRFRPHSIPPSAIHGFANGTLMKQDTSALVSLVLGGVRSARRRYAQQLAERAHRVALGATGSAAGDEMRLRIVRHRAERLTHWRTVEKPLKLAVTIRDLAPSADLILVDCLTFFAATLLESYGTRRAELDAHIEDLCGALSSPTCSVVLVSNEVGSGVVPPYLLGHRYRELLGEINQRVVRVAGDVILMVAGLPLSLKSSPALLGPAQ